MDKTEVIAKAHLESRGHRTIVYEPDGNIPPDFLVDGSIAVEVRRLNQHEEGQALEAVEFPLVRLFERVLPDIGPPPSGESYFVMYVYRRPLPPWKDLEAALRRRLEEFRADPHPGEHVEVVENLELQFIRAGSPHSSLLILGGFADQDSGGFVLAELNKNIRICIEEKTKKVAKVRHRYATWWLLLVDYVAHGVDPEDHEDLKNILQGQHSWDKIIVVNPLDPRHAFEL